MNPFGQVKDLYKFKRQADEMKKQMEAISEEVTEKGVRVVIRGDNEIMELWVDGELNGRVREAVNKALKEIQKKVAKKMRGQLSELGIPGL